MSGGMKMSRRKKRKKQHSKRFRDLKQRIPYRTNCNKVHKSLKDYNRKREKRIDDD